MKMFSLVLAHVIIVVGVAGTGPGRTWPTPSERGSPWSGQGPLNAFVDVRQRQLSERIQQGARDGRLTRAEARRLRRDVQRIAQVEARYRRDGLSAEEQADLNRRLDLLAAHIRWESEDAQRGYNYGYAWSGS